MIRLSPGPCGVCGAAHTACTAAGVRRGAAIRIDQLPALSTTAQLREPPADLAPPPIVDLDVDDELVAERVQRQLPPGAVTTATYRRKGRR